MPEQIIAASILLPTLSKNGLRMESFQQILAGNNISNANQPIKLPQKLHFDLFNRIQILFFQFAKTSSVSLLP